MTIVGNFILKVQAVHKTGVATEHSYRSAIETLFDNLKSGVSALNEPKRVACGAPDFIVQRGELVVGHVEAKDIGVDLRIMKDANKVQQERYRKALPNLIYTNCLAWDFYRGGELLSSLKIADLNGKIVPSPQSYDNLEHLLRDFIAQRPQTITSPKTLAKLMAGKAALVKDVLRAALTQDKDFQSELAAQYLAFRQHLIHDITTDDFADIYAETIAYGMFAARLHDKSLETFDRHKALDLLPRSNPFLRSLFGYIAGPNLDERISWIIDDLAQVFQAADVHKLMEGFGRLTGRDDPFLHFYETFLAAYNPKKRKARGVWYTPEAVVNFIVRSVDDVLRSEFNLPDGLADTSKATVDWDTGQKDKKGKPVTIRKAVHRVQILDPATGTGTFLAEVIKQTAPKVKNVAEGVWSSYVEQDLIPRVHGFELLMASYAMCHLKLDMILSELGYKPTAAPPRLSVYLTNSLEEGDPANQTLPFAQWLSNEVRQANTVKRDMPIMCVIGNPPYNIMSGNLSAEQVALVEPYRSVDGVRIKEKGMLQFEKNINNDYIKFLALSEKLILKNSFGILAFVTSHGYLKSASFRGLRQSLMKTFDAIRILDLHGNTEIKEVVPDGQTDNNIFDIKQGVSVVIAHRKLAKSKGPGTVYYSELWGSRESKYKTLFNSSLPDLEWKDCQPSSPNYTFHPSGREAGAFQSYSFSITDLLPVYSSGVITARDEFVINEDDTVLIKNALEFGGNVALSDAELCEKLGFSQKKGWDIAKARVRMRGFKNPEKLIQTISYRPFDDRKILFDESVIWTTARSTMDHMLAGENVALVTARSEKSGTCSHFYTSRHLVETKCGERTTQSAVFPLYLYPDEQELDKSRRVNFNVKIYEHLQKLVRDKKRGLPDELAVFDYVYGVLHSPAYRARYAEFLKIEFPRIPWPASSTEFWDISEQGSLLRRLHLMEPSVIGKAPYQLLGDGDGSVNRPRFFSGQVWINEHQHFSNVPQVAWDFFVGGYQPAQKWLKDRKGEKLSFENIKHYQRIIKILAETSRMMGEIKLTLP